MADRDAHQSRQWSPRIADRRAPAARPRGLKTALTAWQLPKPLRKQLLNDSDTGVTRTASTCF
nr:hypothetical protein [Porphyrobacter sp. HT-58-2]